MWDLEFNESLIGDGGLIVNCPTHDLEREVAEILGSLGCRYPDGSPLSSNDPWGDYRDDFCYYVDPDRKTRRGDKSGSGYTNYLRYVKCTFYGTPEFDVASKEELADYLRV